METKDPKGQGPYDDREIDVRAIVRISAAIVVVTVATVGLTWGVTRSLSQTEQAGHAAPPAIATELPTSPPEPRLQPSPPVGLKAMRAHEDEILGGYRWVDPDRGVAAIPVADAIDILSRRPLPSRPGSGSTTSLTLPTNSSLRPGIPTPTPPQGGARTGAGAEPTAPAPPVHAPHGSEP
jgi:hypothetical protein